MYKSIIFFLKYLWQVSGTSFSLAPCSVCNAASSAVLSQLIFTPHLEELDSDSFISPPKPLGGHWSREQTLLGRAKTSAIWRMGVILSEHKPLPSSAVAQCAIKSHRDDILRFLQRACRSRPVSLCCTKTCLYPSVRKVVTGVAGYRSAFKTLWRGGWGGSGADRREVMGNGVG